MACCGLTNILCGLSRLLCCIIWSSLSLVITVVIIVVIIYVVLPDSDEKDDSTEATNTAALTAALTLLKIATLSSFDGSVGGTLSLVGGTKGTNSFLAINDLIISSDCEQLEVRLLEDVPTSFNAEGIQIVPVTADIDVATDFTETLDPDFNAELYDQATLWCTRSSGVEEQLGDTAYLETPTTLSWGSTVIRQATLSGGEYKVEGLVQMTGSIDVVDKILVTKYSLRFEGIEMSSRPEVYMYLTTDEDDPENVDADGSLKVQVGDAEGGTFSFNGTYSQGVPDGFVSPKEYVAAVLWCDASDAYFGSGLFVDV